VSHCRHSAAIHIICQLSMTFLYYDKMSEAVVIPVFVKGISMQNFMCGISTGLSSETQVMCVGCVGVAYLFLCGFIQSF